MSADATATHGSPTSGSGCCLLFRGNEGASSGRYLPAAYELVLHGDDVAQHHVMHLHEIHHKVLNDDTSWGAFIHVAARHPEWSRILFPGLVDMCRLIHESFASFMSLSLARARHPDADRVMDAYPLYRPLASRMMRLLGPVPGSHRQDLAATGVARWCMSAPVFDLASDAYPAALAIADIPALWRPDHRFRALMRVRPTNVATAVIAADAAFAARHGQTVAELSLDDSDERLDQAWADWEDAFIEAVVSADPRLARMPTVGADSHLSGAAELVAALARDGVEIGLPHDPPRQPVTDIESVQRLIAAATVTLRPRYRAVLAVPGETVDLEPILALCAAGATPYVVVHARRTAELMGSFLFGAGDTAHLEALAPGPVFAVRVLIDDDGEDVILHAELPDPGSFSRLVGRWGSQGAAANCITASCFLEVDWQHDWLPVLRAWPTVVLVDTGLASMVGQGRLLGDVQPVYGAYIDMADPALKGLVWHVEGHPYVMLVIGDDLTVQLFAGQLVDLLGGRLSMSGADWSEWRQVLSAVAASVLATDARIHYRGAINS